MTHSDHAHPCNFRIARTLDRGWGELAVLYNWDSTTSDLSDLERCTLFELTNYEGNIGMTKAGYYHPPDPPCRAWRFRTPTDGRTAPVALGSITAVQGWAWDRHKLPGQLEILEVPEYALVITALQEYHYCCSQCGSEGVVPGPDAGPHSIVRRIEKVSSLDGLNRWKYTCTKHSITASLDISQQGYITDSAGIGFGPWDPA